MDHPEGGLAITVWATLGEHARMKPLLEGEKHAGLTELTHRGMSWIGIVNSKRKIDRSFAHSCQKPECKNVAYSPVQHVCVHACVCVYSII